MDAGSGRGVLDARLQRLRGGGGEQEKDSEEACHGERIRPDYTVSVKARYDAVCMPPYSSYEEVPVTELERRSSPRIQVHRPGVLTVPTESEGFDAHVVTVLDTSSGGCRIRVPRWVANGTPVGLQFQDSGLKLNGVVRYCRRPLSSDEEEYHIGVQYFDPEDPTGGALPENLQAVGEVVLSLVGEESEDGGTFGVRLVQETAEEVVVIAPRYVYPDTDVRLQTPNEMVIGYTRRCGAALGGYRVVIVVDRREFRWSSVVKNPLHAARYVLGHPRGKAAGEK